MCQPRLAYRKRSSMTSLSRRQPGIHSVTIPFLTVTCPRNLKQDIFPKLRLLPFIFRPSLKEYHCIYLWAICYWGRQMASLKCRGPLAPSAGCASKPHCAANSKFGARLDRVSPSFEAFISRVWNAAAACQDAYLTHGGKTKEGDEGVDMPLSPLPPRLCSALLGFARLCSLEVWERSSSQ